MRKISLGLAAGLLALALYAADGWRDALRDTPRLKTWADAIIQEGRGPDSLSDWQLEAYLKVEDPAFFDHGGVNFFAPDAGNTTITQSLAQRLAFKEFHPGIGKVRQTAYAMALESQLSKAEILALALDQAPMGTKDGRWITGVHEASEAFYGRPVGELEARDFLALVAVMVAPGDLTLTRPDLVLERRVVRIERLLRGDCMPKGTGDIWLDGCRLS